MSDVSPPAARPVKRPRSPARLVTIPPASVGPSISAGSIIGSAIAGPVRDTDRRRLRPLGMVSFPRRNRSLTADSFLLSITGAGGAMMAAGGIGGRPRQAPFRHGEAL